MQKAPQLGHLMTPGAVSFHTEERLLSRLCLDTLPFGTAMLTPPDSGCFEQHFYLLFIQKLLKYSKSWINLFPAPTGAEVEIFAAGGAETLAVLFTEEFCLHIQDE